MVPGKTYSSPANGPHGIKFYINAATGRADLKASPGLVTRSLGRIVEAAPTLSLPQEQVLAGNSNVESYCTTKRRGGRRKLPSTFSIYSDVGDLQSLLQRQRNIQSQNKGNLLQNLTEEESDEDGWNAADVCADIICTTDDEDDAESSSDLTSSSSPLAAELGCNSTAICGWPKFLLQVDPSRLRPGFG